MRYIAVFMVLIINAIVVPQTKALEVGKTEFYKAFAGESEEEMDRVLAKLQSSGNGSKVRAYQGALLMKKSSFSKGVKAKVNTFKKGAKLLEKEIDGAPGNAEYRFLRLCVQEHAPGILGYNKDLSEDTKVVAEGYPKMDSELKKIVKDYASGSKELKLADPE